MNTTTVLVVLGLVVYIVLAGGIRSAIRVAVILLLVGLASMVATSLYLDANPELVTGS